MSGDGDLEHLLTAEAVDAGCAAGFELLHQYVEEELAGGQPASSHPALASHLQSCPACREDYYGLLEAAKTFGDAVPDPHAT